MMPIVGDTVTADMTTAAPDRTASDRDALRLRRARALDRNTLGSIYDDYHRPLYNYIYRRVGDVETARDLTADVFRRFLQATANGSGPDDNLRAWLFRVAHNVVIDHYRRQQHRRCEPLSENVAGEADPGRQAEIRLQVERVRQALGQLTPDQQQVIALRFLEGLSCAEVATTTQRSVGAVKALQHRALAALRRLIAADEEIPA